MEFVEQLINWLQQLPPAGVLAFMFFVAYIENLFPPSPSDVLIVFAGTLIGVGAVGFAPALVVTTLGSTTGFMTAYFLGRYFDQFVHGKLSRFLPINAINQVERLFQRYGYGVIVANRFLAGTRAIVSFFAGMSRMNLPVTTALCAASAAVWNAILLYLGFIFANNWRQAAGYLETYSKIATGVVIAAIALVLLVYFRRRRRETGNRQPTTDNQ
ncbi:MAG: DedA family protein [Blastocatellia bacterium]